MTASQPASRVLTRCRSSSFSLSLALSFSRSSSFCSWEWCGGAVRPMPARSCLFSSSSSETRCSRYENCALRRSREFWAAMRLRCARASLRSSGVTSERARLRGGPDSSEVWELGDGEGESSSGESAWSMSAARFMTGLWIVASGYVERAEEKETGLVGEADCGRRSGVRGGR